MVRIPIIISNNHVVFPKTNIQIKTPTDYAKNFFARFSNNSQLIAYYVELGKSHEQIAKELLSCSPESIAKKTFVICSVEDIKRVDGSICLFSISALYRARVESCDRDNKLIIGSDFTRIDVINDLEADKEQALRSLLCEKLVQNNYNSSYIKKDLTDPSKSSADLIDSICGLEVRDGNELIDNILIKVINSISLQERFYLVNSLLKLCLDINQYDTELDDILRERIDKNQRDFYLKERLKVLNKELNGDQSAHELLQDKAEKLRAHMSKEAIEKVEYELGRIKTMYQSSPEWDNTVHYLESILGLPWCNKPHKVIDIEKVAKCLDEKHFGLKRVKERIIDLVLVLQRQIMSIGRPKGQIICLVGAPGVGKTSIAHSLTKALGRPLIHIPLGGVRDEHEIRGHRKSYIAATMGVIMTKIKQAGTTQVVIVLDEIDKISTDSLRGNPAAALLEVLDPIQNVRYRDHYLDIGFDLSQVIFIATANSYHIYPPLLDRMEVIELDGYSRQEKYNIARNFIIPSVLSDQLFLPPNSITLSPTALYRVIDEYSPESGVRQLHRNLSLIIQKTYRAMVKRKAINECCTISKKDIDHLLKDYIAMKEPKASGKKRVGVVNGLAFVEDLSIGTIVTIEVVTLPSKDTQLETIVSGNVGKVMNESSKLATVVASNYVPQLTDSKLHIHFAKGGIPKDGPSAGIAVCSAIISAALKSPVSTDVAMTGELSLTGHVLPIGGVAQKIRVAVMTGVKNIIVPFDNKQQVDILDKKELSSARVHYVKHMDDVYKMLFSA